jgi:hypothetical protein
MEILLILIYAALCIAIFKIFRIPVNKWTLPTAALGGIFMIGFILLVMNYNHPFTANAPIYFATTPIMPDVKGRVVEVPVEANAPLKQGDILFRIGTWANLYPEAERLRSSKSTMIPQPTTYQAVRRLRLPCTRPIGTDFPFSGASFCGCEAGRTMYFSKVTGAAIAASHRESTIKTAWLPEAALAGQRPPALVLHTLRLAPPPSSALQRQPQCSAGSCSRRHDRRASARLSMSRPRLRSSWQRR